MEISKVGVAGCGLMGHGIAQVSAEAGFDVVVSEVSQEALDKGVAKIEKQLVRAVEKGKLDQAEADAVRARIHPTLELADFADCDLVIEAVTEDLPTKLELWEELDGIVGEGAFFATNTSSLPVAEQAAVTGRPGRFLGLHFFNPVQRMPLLEVIAAEDTEASTMEAGVGYGERLGKTVVETKDKPGFIVNRLLVPYLLDGIRGYEEGIGSVAEIDVAMKAGAGHPMGPLTLCDVVGLDTLASIAGVDTSGDEVRGRDLTPVLAEVADAEGGDLSAAVSGIAFGPLAGGSTGVDPSADRPVFFAFDDHQCGTAYTDVTARPNRIRAVRTKDSMYAIYCDPDDPANRQYELYDLRRDPTQVENLVDVDTGGVRDPRDESLRQRMAQALEEQVEQCRSPLPGG